MLYGGNETMTLCERYATADTVVARDLVGEVVLMDLAGGIYFGLNEVGAKIWWALEAHQTISEISTSLAQEFSIEQATVESDVRELLVQLLEKDLIVEIHA